MDKFDKIDRQYDKKFKEIDKKWDRKLGMRPDTSSKGKRFQNRVKKYLENKGWKVLNVSNNKKIGYDLHATSSRGKIYLVECKSGNPNTTEYERAASVNNRNWIKAQLKGREIFFSNRKGNEINL